MGWRRYAKPRYGMIAGFLLLVGVIVPAVFGLLTEKAMEIGTADLLDKSTKWDSSNIANSTYFLLNGKPQFPDVLYKSLDNNTYRLSVAYDDTNDFSLALATKTSDIVGTTSTKYEVIDYVYYLNKTALENVDKIVVVLKIEDTGSHNITGDHLYVTLLDWNTFNWKYQANATDAVNKTVRIEIPIDAVKRLQLSSSPADKISMYVSLYADGVDNSLSNVVFGSKVELYDVKKVNASAISNTMLVTAGLLSWIGAFAATPYWNPMKNPSHRDVRRVTRKIRRRRRR